MEQSNNIKTLCLRVFALKSPRLCVSALKFLCLWIDLVQQFTEFVQSEWRCIV